MALTENQFANYLRFSQDHFSPCEEIDLSNNSHAFQLSTIAKPTIVKNSAIWKNSQTWSKAYIEEKFGKLTCTVARDLDTINIDLYIHNLSFKNYLNESIGESAFARIPYEQNQYHPFIDEIAFPNYVFSEALIKDILFYHAKQRWGALPHIHDLIALNLLHDGIKLWVFFDANPRLANNGFMLSQHYAEKYGHVASASNWFNQEFKNLASKKVPVYTCLQRAEDLVFVPDNYCHAVLNLEDTQGFIIMLNKRCNDK